MLAHRGLQGKSIILFCKFLHSTQHQQSSSSRNSRRYFQSKSPVRKISPSGALAPHHRPQNPFFDKKVPRCRHRLRCSPYREIRASTCCCFMSSTAAASSESTRPQPAQNLLGRFFARKFSSRIQRNILRAALSCLHYPAERRAVSPEEPNTYKNTSPTRSSGNRPWKSKRTASYPSFHTEFPRAMQQSDSAIGSPTSTMQDPHHHAHTAQVPQEYSGCVRVSSAAPCESSPSASYARLLFLQSSPTVDESVFPDILLAVPGSSDRIRPPASSLSRCSR